MGPKLDLLGLPERLLRRYLLSTRLRVPWVTPGISTDILTIPMLQRPGPGKSENPVGPDPAGP